MKYLLLFTLILFGTFLTFASDTEASEKSDATKGGEAYLTSGFIQLPPLWIPTYNQKQEFRKMLVFTGRILIEEGEFKNVCLNVPKITDTVIVYLNRNPLPKDGLEQKNLADLSQTLLSKIKKELNLKGVKAFELHRGDLKQDDQNKVISSMCNRMQLVKK